MQQNRTISPAQLYEEFYGPAIFAPLAKALLEFAPPPRGGKVLDLACGTGLLARAVAPLVGPDGAVLAVDINPAMLSAGRLAPLEGGAPITWMEADASTAVFPPQELHAAYCQQGLQFFPDRLRALNIVRGALRPGGFFALATWKGIEHHPLFAAFAEVESRHLRDLDVTFDDIVAPFSLGDRAAVHSLLTEAGFTDLRAVEHVVQARFTDPHSFTRNMETAYGAVIPRFVEDRRAFEKFVGAVEEETREIVARFTVGGELRFSMPTNMFAAVAAEA